MKLDLSKVSFSRKDITLGVRVPKVLDKELAYLVGIHIGDGSMNIYNKYHYYINYSGHLIDEYIWYTKDFYNLFIRLFNKKLSIKKDLRENKESIRLTATSKAVFTFLQNSVGLEPGPKISTKIPKVILKSEYLKDFIKGLADADFCLSFRKKYKKKHYYPSISLGSNNKTLVNEIIKVLRKMNFNCYVCLDFYKKRYKKEYISNLVEINGVDQLEHWMKTIGFDSRKHLTKYLIWKKFGFCPPYTTLPQRENILSGKIDSHSFYKE